VITLFSSWEDSFGFVSIQEISGGVWICSMSALFRVFCKRAPEFKLTPSTDTSTETAPEYVSVPAFMEKVIVSAWPSLSVNGVFCAVMTGSKSISGSPGLKLSSARFTCTGASPAFITETLTCPFNCP